MRAAGEKISGVRVAVADLIDAKQRLAALSIATPRRQAGYRSGLQDSRLRGRGMEYAESRPYIAGDDVRSMDWRVMARTGKPHTKIFTEARERRFLLAVDLSASMYFGTRYALKSWAAAHTAAHAGWLASLSANHIGGLVVSPDDHHEVRPRKTHSGLLRLFHHLAAASNIDHPSVADSRLNFLLRELLRVAKPGSIIALVTDFIGLDALTQKLLRALVKQNDVIAFWISDGTETTAWPAGLYPVLASRRRFDVDLTRNQPAAWLNQKIHRHRQQIESLAMQFQLPLIPISCNRDITAQIAQHWGLK